MAQVLAGGSTTEITALHWSKRDTASADESGYAKLVADHLGLDCLEIDVGLANTAAEHFQVSPRMIVPFTHPSRLWLDRLAQTVRGAGIRLVITGGHSDTIFGSPIRDARLHLTHLARSGLRYAARTVFEWLGTPLPVRGMFAARASRFEGLDRNDFAEAAMPLLSVRGRHALSANGGYRFPRVMANPWAGASYQNIKGSFENEYDVETTLAVGAANGFRIVHPLASRDLIEFGLSLPGHFRVAAAGGRLYEKPLLRLAYADALPAQVVRRSGRLWLANLYGGYWRDGLPRLRQLFGSDSVTREMELLDPVAIHRALTGEVGPNEAVVLMQAASVELWLRSLVEPDRGRLES